MKRITYTVYEKSCQWFMTDYRNHAALMNALRTIWRATTRDTKIGSGLRGGSHDAGDIART
ncbi:MAG TPA: hypothetical protein VF290_02575 [Pyrinomonadaceae bacterium]